MSGAHTQVPGWCRKQKRGSPAQASNLTCSGLHTAAGVLLDRAELERASQLCSDAGAWLVVDNTYEHFVYDGGVHACVSGPHVINMFSFSKVRVQSSLSPSCPVPTVDGQISLTPWPPFPRYCPIWQSFQHRRVPVHSPKELKSESVGYDACRYIQARPVRRKGWKFGRG